MANTSCIFCDIASGEMTSYKIWESDTYMAFLTPFPNTPGVTVVIPKEHQDSYIFNVDNAVMTGLMYASREVAKIIDARLPDVGRCGVVFEGFGINHLHAKLFPMHGTADMKEWKNIESRIDTFFDTYPGYISSHDAAMADPEELEAMAEKLRGES